MAQKTLADFEKDIPAVAELLAETPKMQQFFNDLTPGYQREWARFIFGAKAEATKNRHIEVMKTVFKAGYKSKRAYDSRSKE
ncbi:YdeI/OmpD-associated family protein [Lactobacillus sp. LC28-10]|uniref:YdeI/OmpD-associated family protein n=1 Tax=Secundilactobacillus angelensis TaxID=2722706 RepID=A0ABX1L249_9LACO|nr:YdeI/OmpD-associated family protein [Secundilactobacillus angelensis]MCH5462656.1 YdeI/OmpD-associated family protein [Secundilactobacillus angelensis]NLR19148.1 YdeI/OmpD-associated family protein [Secundilactobacillus angelensis]